MTIWHRLRNRIIHILAWCLEKAEWKADPPHPDAVQRAKGQPHYFVIKITYDPDIDAWLAEYSGIEHDGFQTYTQGLTLPDALFMAGDLGRLNLEHMMAFNAYPFTPDYVQTFDGMKPA